MTTTILSLLACLIGGLAGTALAAPAPAKEKIKIVVAVIIGIAVLTYFSITS